MKSKKFIVFSLLICLVFSVTLIIGCTKNNVPKFEESQYSISIKNDSVNLILGENLTLAVETDGIDTNLLKWECDNLSVATVDNGKVYSKSVGTARVTVSYGDFSDSCIVNVSLGQYLPELCVDVPKEEVKLVTGQTFVMTPYVSFNGIKFYDFSLTVDVGGDVIDYSTDNNTLTLSAIKKGTAQLTLKASWNSLTAETTETLIKTFILDVQDDLYFTINGHGVEDVTLYTFDEFEGQKYANSINLNVNVIKNDQVINDAEITVNVQNDSVAELQNDKLCAVGYGTTTIKLIYEASDTILENTFEVNVLRPEAKPIDTNITYSIEDNVFDLSGVNFEVEDIYEVEIAGVKFSVDNGKLPEMYLQNYTSAPTGEHVLGETLRLTVAGISEPIEIYKTAEEKDFGSINVKVYLKKYIVELTNVHVYSRILNNADDLTAVFGGETVKEKLEGYYILGGNIDATSSSLRGYAKNRANFHGIFDGMGYTISNANVSGMEYNGSFFGALQGHATVRNVAFENVEATDAAVIASYAGGASGLNGQGWPNPLVENVYIKVKPVTYRFRGVIQNNDAYVSNVLVNYPVNEKLDGFGAFFGTAGGAISEKYDSCILISESYAFCSEGNELLAYGITRYESLIALQQANLSFNNLNRDYWVVADGLPSWKNAEPQVVAIKDNMERSYDISKKELDLSNLPFTLSNVEFVEIGGVKASVLNGEMPDMTLENKSVITVDGTHQTEDVLRLGFSTTYVDITKTDSNIDFSSVSFKLYIDDGSIYELANVHVYSKILKNANDLTEVFGDKSGTLTGYYILGNNIDASTATLRGANKVARNTQFKGIFDGMGYTISNADVSGQAYDGSFFGSLIGLATVRNVAFVNVKATGAGVIANGSGSDGSGSIPLPLVSNVYIEMSADTTNSYGVIANNTGYTENVIVKFGSDNGNVNGFGAFFSHANNADNQNFSNCYLISSSSICNGVEDSNVNGITRYETEHLMINANNNYDSFMATCWMVENGGIPVWKNLPN